MTRRRFHIALGILLASCLTSAGDRETFVVIVNKSNRFDVLSRARVEYLFLRKVSRWPWGAEVFPIDLDTPGTARRDFTSQVLHTTGRELANYWIDQRMTRGVVPPGRVASVAGVKALVAATPGAIAYIPPAACDRTVKILRVEQ
jgi:ABC-type phosphate transport system substrate-binding protein